MILISYFIRLSTSVESSIPIMKKNYDVLEGVVGSAVVELSKRRGPITVYALQKETGIRKSNVARNCLRELCSQGVLLKGGVCEVYYVNPNQPSARSPRFLRMRRNSR